MYIKNEETLEETVLFSPEENPLKPLKSVAKIEDQEQYESQRLWSKVTKAILKNDMEEASKHKHAIENNQRALLKKRQDANEDWEPRFFEFDGDQNWRFKHEYNSEEELQKILFPRDKERPFWIEGEWKVDEN